MVSGERSAAKPVMSSSNSTVDARESPPTTPFQAESTAPDEDVAVEAEREADTAADQAPVASAEKAAEPTGEDDDKNEGTLF